VAYLRVEGYFCNFDVRLRFTITVCWLLSQINRTQYNYDKLSTVSGSGSRTAKRTHKNV